MDEIRKGLFYKKADEMILKSVYGLTHIAFYEHTTFNSESINMEDSENA